MMKTMTADHKTKGSLGDERGIALVMALILSAIILSLSAALLFFLIYGERISGLEKRYKTALEASRGGADLVYQLIGTRGETTSTNILISDLSALSMSIPLNSSSCSGTDISGTSYSGLPAKLNTATLKSDGTLNWSNCSTSLTIDPTDNSTYDTQFSIGTNPTYTVYSKIVNTIEGNTGADFGLMKDQVVSANEQAGRTLSYMYTIEIDAENSSNPDERAKLSVLYQY